MKFGIKWLAGAAALVVLASASVALGSGGATAGTGIDIVSGGGGGTVTAPPPPAAPCAQISSYKVTTGKYQSWAAIWANYTVKNCGIDESQTVTVDMINYATGNVDYSRSLPTWLGVSKTVSQLWDNDFAPWSTTYQVRITVTETATGAVLATQSIDAGTGVPKI